MGATHGFNNKTWAQPLDMKHMKYITLLVALAATLTLTAQDRIDQRLQELGIELPAAATPVANYVNAVTTGNLVFLAGKGPNLPEGGYITGKVGRDLTIEEGYAAARLTGISQLAALKAHLGSLDRVKRIVKVTGMVNATDDFTNQPEVINGFSDLMVEVFGDKGKHARSAVGMASLPRNIAVEIEMIVEIE
jgi:enamine deaminase RidA (YjgF/YER057c/UK114 family)